MLRFSIKNKQTNRISVNCSISKESIIDIYVRPVTVAAKIEFCTEQNLELVILEIFLVSAAKPQLPLQIEDASRPEHNDVNL